MMEKHKEDMTAGSVHSWMNEFHVSFKRGATLDFLLHISAHILVIIGFRHPDQIAKVCTLTCFYTLVALNSNFKTLIDGVILAKQASSSESNQTLY